MCAYLKNLLFPSGRLSNSFPWTVQTAGKKYLAGVLRFMVGSFLVPFIVIGSILLLAKYPLLRACFLDTAGTIKFLGSVGLIAAALTAAFNFLRLRRKGSLRILSDLLVATPYYLLTGMAAAVFASWAVTAFDPYFEPVLNWVVPIISEGKGKPNMTFVMVLSLISFVMGFGAQVHYIAREMRKSGLSLAKAMALTFEPLKGRCFAATVFNVLLPVGIAYGASQLIGEGVVYLMGPAHQPTVEMAKQATGGNFLLFALMAVVGAPILEEIVFRGFLFQVVRCSLLQGVQPLVLAAVPANGPRRLYVQADNWVRVRSHAFTSALHRLFGGARAELSAIVLSSLMFSLMHMQFQPTTLVLLFLLGCIQAEIYRRTGSLYCGMLLHALNNGIDVLKLALGQA